MTIFEETVEDVLGTTTCPFTSENVNNGFISHNEKMNYFASLDTESLDLDTVKELLEIDVSVLDFIPGYLKYRAEILNYAYELDGYGTDDTISGKNSTDKLNWLLYDIYKIEHELNDQITYPEAFDKETSKQFVLKNQLF